MRTKQVGFVARFLRIGWCLSILMAGWRLAQAPAAAVSFNVTPSTVSNSYSGTITLQIGGLTNRETVVVQKFLDINGNGVVDSGDWLVQQFQLTDGQAGMVFGGIVNSNVPGDTDSTSGQITAKLNFQNGDSFQNVAGKFLYKLSSPNARFTAVTNLFTVTNLPCAQSFSGNVVSNGASTTLPNALVLLFGPPRPGDSGPSGPSLGGAVANNSGAYSIPAAAGTYMLAAFKSNYLVNFSALPVLTLRSGQPVVTNLTLTKATSSISGQLVDAGNSSIALPGLLLSAKATNGLMGAAFTDTNGHFLVGVLPNLGQWNVGPNDAGMIIHGYLYPQDKGTNVNAGTTNVVIARPRATALFYGSVKDNLGNPLPRLELYADDNHGTYEGSGYTDANGNYAAPALGGLNNDPWQVGLSSATLPGNFLFLQPDCDLNGGTNIGAGQAVLANFIAMPATNHITGHLIDAATGLGIANIGVPAWATINGVQFMQYAATDANGSYSNSVASGTWAVNLNTGSCGDCLSSSLYLCTNSSQTVIISNSDAVVDFTALAISSQITGYLKDNNNTPIVGIGVWASAVINGVNCNQGNADTDANGYYSLGVVNGAWTVGVSTCGDCGDGLPGGYLYPPNQSVVISNNNGVANFTAIAGATNLIIGEVRQASGNPVSNVGVEATATINGVIYSVTADTDGNGNYSLNVANNANWVVGVYCDGCPCGNLNGLDNILGAGNYTCPSNEMAVINNDNATVNFIVQPYAGLSIATTSLPAGEVNVYYDQFLQATTAYPPVTWSLTSGSPPPGLMESGSTGEISGIPTNTGTFNLAFQATDNNSETATVGLSLTIYAPVQVTTTLLPNGSYGHNYSVSLEALDGLPPYSWSLSPGSDSLPPGLTLTPDGTLSGTPTTLGTFYFFARVTDAAMGTYDQFLSLTVRTASSLQVATKTLPEGAQRASYSQQLAASGGTPPYTWSLSPGSDSLPAGLTLSTNGILSGTPSAGGSYYFFVRVTDATAAAADQLLVLNILNVATPSLPNGEQGVSYSQQLLASNGLPPYIWSLSPGSAGLPPGLSLSTNGILSGNPNNTGVLTFTVSVTDGASMTASRALTLLTILSYQSRMQIPTLSLAALLPSGGCQLTVGGIGGQCYMLEYSTNLADWYPLCCTNFNGSSFTYTDCPAADHCRFYRAYASGSTFAFSQPVYYASETNGSPMISMARSDSVTNGSALISVVRSGGLSSGLYMQYSTTSGGTAVPGVDYDATAGTLYFPPNVASNGFPVTILPVADANQDVTVVVQLTSLDGKITQYAALYIHRQQLPAAIPVIYPGKMTFILPFKCSQTITVSNAGPRGSILNYFVKEADAVGGNVEFTSVGGGVWSSYFMGSLPSGASTQIQVEPTEVALDYYWATRGMLPLEPSWRISAIELFMPTLNPSSWEHPAVAIYPLEITTIDKLFYKGAWSGIWSGTAQANNLEIPVDGTYTLQITGLNFSGANVSGASGSFTWQGSDVLFNWSGTTNEDGSPIYTPSSDPVNLEWPLRGWGVQTPSCGGGTIVLTPPQEFDGPDSFFYQLLLSNCTFTLNSNGQLGCSGGWVTYPTECGCALGWPTVWPAWSHGSFY